MHLGILPLYSSSVQVLLCPEVVRHAMWSKVNVGSHHGKPLEMG